MSAIFFKAHIWGELTFICTTSIVASGIFFYINVYLEQTRVRRIMYPVIKERLMHIGVTASMIMMGLSNGRESTIPDEDTIKELYGGIPLNSKPLFQFPTGANYDTWRDFFQHKFDSVRVHSEILFKYSAHIPPEILVLLHEVQYSTFEMSLDNTINWPEATIGNPAGGLSTYLQNLQDITGKEAMRVLN
jgi:hypothetical protein